MFQGSGTHHVRWAEERQRQLVRTHPEHLGRTQRDPLVTLRREVQPVVAPGADVHKGLHGPQVDEPGAVPVGDRTQVAVVSFGESTGSGRLAPLKNVRGKFQLATDNSAGDPITIP